MLKKLSLVLSILLLFLTLMSCGAVPGPAGTESESDTGSEIQPAPDGIWFQNGFRSKGTPAFSLPKAEPDSVSSIGSDDHSYYIYEDITEEQYADYLTVLESEGVSVRRMYHESFCRTDDCLIWIDYSPSQSHLGLFWYARSAGAPVDGMTERDAELLLCPGQTLSPLSLRPVDITPEGFYERTGGQIFAAPSYTFDTFTEQDYPGMIRDENEHYSCRILFVRGDNSLYSDMECFAAADLNGDGTEEICALRYGYTSGIFTFVFEVLSGSETSTNFYYSAHMTLSFGEKDGKLIVLGRKQDAETTSECWIRTGSLIGIPNFSLYDPDPNSILALNKYVILAEREQDPEYDGLSQTITFEPGGIWSWRVTGDYLMHGTYEEADGVLTCSADCGEEKIKVVARIEAPGVIRIVSVQDDLGALPWLHPGDVLSNQTPAES